MDLTSYLFVLESFLQEQQQKQLDLILAIAKSGNLFDKKQVPVQKKEAVEKRHSAEKVVKQTGTPQIQALASQKETNKEAAQPDQKIGKKQQHMILLQGIQTLFNHLLSC